MDDIFNKKIICEKCNKEMTKTKVERDGFILRCVECPNCKEKIIHPSDLHEYKNFSDLKRKHYKVKLRLVGNSYAVSIPKEIVQFMREQEKMMDDMVRLVFEDAKKLMLRFGEEN